jgi:hypothetical protein
MSTLNVNTINPVQATESLNLQTGGTTRFEISSAGLITKAPTGMVLQVVEQTWNLDFSPAVTFASDGAHTASSWVHAFSGTITPSSTTSKMLVQATVQLKGTDAGANWDSPELHANVHRLNSDGTTALSFISGSGSEPTGGYTSYTNQHEAIVSHIIMPITITRLDTPNSTDALVYDVVVRCAGNWTTVYMYGGVMIMQEIAG